MSSWKWGLALLGAFVGGLPGGLIGFLVGSTIDKKANKTVGADIGRGKVHSGTLKDADIALVLLIASVLKADGVVRRSELDAVKRFLSNNYNEEDGKKILGLLRNLVKPTTTIDLEPACDFIRQHTDYTTRYHMTDFLFCLALADGELHGLESQTLQTIAQHLLVTKTDYTSMFYRHTRGQYTNYQSSFRQANTHKEDPYKVLGIDHTATDEEVKKAYRRMAMRYHPDKVDNLGEEMKRNATEQFRTINEAYETIKRERNII